jgi:hypothetical protein
MWVARLTGICVLVIGAGCLELAGPPADASTAAGRAAPAVAITQALAPDRIAAMMRTAGIIRPPAPRPPSQPSQPGRAWHDATRARIMTRTARRGVPRGLAARGLRGAAGRRAPLIPDSGLTRSKVGLPAPVMSVDMTAANAVKQAQAQRFLARQRRRLSPDATCVTQACRTGLPASKVLAASQQPQNRNYWCGPATVSEMLSQLGVRRGQATVARQLRTTTGGTDWSNNRGYPVPSVLNANQHRNTYVAVALPWSPTSKQIRTYQSDLVADVNHGKGVPLAGNAYEVPGGPHLVGHPPDQKIAHWFDIRGYASSGAVTQYEDSVHGAPSIGWAASVPAYSALPSSTIVNILGARGYDW